VLALVPRRVASREMPFDAEGRRVFWKDTYVDVGSDAGKFVSVLSDGERLPMVITDEKMSLGDVFADFPVALLVVNR